MAKKTVVENIVRKPITEMIERRLKQLDFMIEENKVGALCVNYLPSIRYLTNFSGSAAMLFISHDEIHFITDDRYEEQIKNELFDLPNLKTHIIRDPWELVADKKILKGIKAIAFEDDRLSYGDAVSIRNKLRPIKFKPANQIIERYTVPKSPEEASFIKEACNISLKAFDKLIPLIKPGVTEIDLAIELIYNLRKLGSEGEPFDIIVTSGERGALVHGKPSNRKIKKGDIIIVDWGAKVNGFGSDITRTVAVGKATDQQKEIYKMLIKAKEEAIANIRPAMNGKHLDEYARKIVKKSGYGKNFQHSLGHGIGLVAHESPIITFRKDDQIVPEDAVLAIEPGVYLPDKFGMRVEDIVQVTRNGGVHFTKAPEELLIIG